MAEALPGWTPEVERSFKEVLFRFLEEVHCTKAALYLLAPDGCYILVSQYGFGRRDLLAVEHQPHDPIVVQTRKLRNRPMVVNHPREMPEISAYLRGAGTARMLIVPLFADLRVVGFVDARDKGGQRPFETVDLRQGAVIGGALLDLLRRQGLYRELASETEVAPEPPAPQPVRLAGPSEGAVLDEGGLRDVNEAAVGVVVREGVFAVALTVATPDAAATVVYSGARPEDVEADAIVRHQAEVLARAKVSAPHHTSWRLDVRRVHAAPAALRASLVASGVPVSTPGWVLALSVVAAEGGPPADAALERLQRIAETAHELSELRFSRRALCRRLLEPGERKHPDLVAHSLAVSRLCWLISKALDFDDRSTEEAVLAGLLHDVGMRELDYDRLYRHQAPSPEERRLYRQHVIVGERILRGTGMDRVAGVIRHHHERWDGQGYPDQLAGEAVPLLSRVVHVAEVFDVLTSSSSYRPTVPIERALATMRAAGGQQFDANLVQVLSQVVR